MLLKFNINDDLNRISTESFAAYKGRLQTLAAYYSWQSQKDIDQGYGGPEYRSLHTAVLAKLRELG